MPKNPNRLRHGIGHSRLPSQAVVSGGQSQPTRVATGTPAKAAQAPVNESRVIPVRMMDVFYQNMPSPSVQQITKLSENDFSTTDLETGFNVLTITTPSEQVYVWTDFFFYGKIPGNGLCSPPGILTSYQLSGLVRFDITIRGVSPMDLASSTMSPYRNGAVYPNIPAQNLSGWPVLDTAFGSQRGNFALYSRSGESLQIWLKGVQSQRFPRFFISSVGSQIHGFSVPEGQFDEVWQRAQGRD